MAKRFTDTDIFRDPWFRKLSLKHKCLWQFLCAECDFAGVWKVDYDLASYVIGDIITAADLEFINNDKERARVVNDKLVLIVDFVDFQYGDKIKGSSNPFHRKISNRLSEIDTLSTGCLQGVDTLSDTLLDTPQDKDKEKEKEEVKEEDKRDYKGEKEHKQANPDVEYVYSLYPIRDKNNNRTVGKSINDVEKIKEILSQGKYPLAKAIKLHLLDVQRSGSWLRDFGTFLNNLPGLDVLADWEKRYSSVLAEPQRPRAPDPPCTPEEEAAYRLAVDTAVREARAKLKIHVA